MEAGTEPLEFKITPTPGVLDITAQITLSFNFLFLKLYL